MPQSHRRLLSVLSPIG
ncbi:MAG: hypothetical protein ACLRZ2_06245, partial [Veillonella sp.]